MHIHSNITPHCFILCPDREYARGLRRALVKAHGTVHVQVGTFEELVELSHIKRLLDLEEVNLEANFTMLLEALVVQGKTAFWSNSFCVDQSGVTSALLSAIDMLINANGPDINCDWTGGLSDQRLIERVQELQALALLADESRCLIPLTQKLLNVVRCQTPSVAPVYVLASSLCEVLSALQMSFLNKLKADCEPVQFVFNGQSIDNFSSLLRSTIDAFDAGYTNKPLAKKDDNLNVIQQRLFRPRSNVSSLWNPTDDSVKWVRCRDTLESIELVIGSIQKALKIDSSLKAHDFGILLPRSFQGHAQLRFLFESAGLPLANLRWTATQRNLAGELLSQALMAYEGGCPKLALKSLLTSPLVPWTQGDATTLVSSVDRYGFQFKIPSHFKSQWQSVLLSLQSVLARQDLVRTLSQLQAILKTEGLNDVQLLSLDEQFSKVLSAAKNEAFDYEAIRKLLNLSVLEIEESTGPFLDGVTVWYEEYLPWREVKRLFVLDFISGNFPSQFQCSPVFTESDWGKVGEQCGGVRDAVAQRTIAQNRLIHQLNHISEQVIFLCPAFDELGKALNPSESLIDCALLAGKLDSPEDLVLDVREPQDRHHLSELMWIDQAVSPSPRFELIPGSIDLGIDLLAHFKTKKKHEGEEWVEVTKPQSPSALDDLLLCPLGWFLKQLGAENRVWEPESFTPLTSGLLAHDVMEQLFAQGQVTIPSEDEINSSVLPLLEQAIRKKAPFLNNGIWKVERQNLLNTVRKAAITWAELLSKLDAKVVAPEMWLEGGFHNQPIHGQTDCVISLPDQSVLVVDFKTSKSDKYEKRMRAKLDLQASLYEQMLKTGGPKKNDEVRAEGVNLKQLSGVVYFTLKDRQATSNFRPIVDMGSWRTVSPLDENGLPSLHSKDVSSRAMDLLRERFDQLRKGQLLAVSQNDIKQFAADGFQQYIFESTPLIKAAVIVAQNIEVAGDE